MSFDDSQKKGKPLTREAILEELMGLLTNPEPAGKTAGDSIAQILHNHPDILTRCAITAAGAENIYQSHYEMTLIRRAAMRGKWNAVRKLIPLCPNTSEMAEEYKSVLNEAVDHGQHDIANQLILKLKSFKKPLKDEALLSWAIKNEYVNLVHILLQHLVDDNHKDYDNAKKIINWAMKKTENNPVFNHLFEKRKFAQDYYIKTLRCDTLNFFRNFALNTTRTDKQRKKANFRPKSKKRFITLGINPSIAPGIKGKNIFDRSQKPKLYKTHPDSGEKIDIKHHSPYQSFTLVVPRDPYNIVPKYFGSGVGGGNKREKLIGVIQDEESETPPVAELFYKKDCATFHRPNEFHTIEEAEEFWEEKAEGEDAVVFSNKESFLQSMLSSTEAEKKHHNEVLLRVKWDKKTGCIFIPVDNLESRLLAQDFARILLSRLKKEAEEKGENWDENYHIPIYYYMPDDPSKHLSPYHIFDQANDRLEAYKIANNEILRGEKRDAKDFEFLLALSPRNCVEVLNDFYDNHLLMKLLEEGYVHIAQSLIEKAQSIDPYLLENLKQNLRTNPNSMALFHCARTGNLELLEWLLSLTWSVPYKNDKFNALTIACENGHLGIVERLLKIKEFKDDINTLFANQYLRQHKTPVPKTPLMHAAEWGHAEIADLLIQEGADINYTVDDKSALLAATASNRANVIQLFLNKYADKIDLKHKDKMGNTILMWAARIGSLEITKLLLETQKINLDEKNIGKNTALDLAFTNADVAMIEMLKKYVVADETLISTCQNIFISFLKNRYSNTETDAFSLLQNDVSHLSSQHSTRELYSTLLQLACKYNNTLLAKKILKHAHEHINVDEKDSHGMTLLMWAAQNGNTRLINKLLKYKADINAVDEEGNTALILSCKLKKFKSAKLLFSKGANTSIKNKSGFTVNEYLPKPIMLFEKMINPDPPDKKIEEFVLEALKNGDAGFINTFDGLDIINHFNVDFKSQALKDLILLSLSDSFSNFAKNFSLSSQRFNILTALITPEREKNKRKKKIGYSQKEKDVFLTSPELFFAKFVILEEKKSKATRESDKKRIQTFIDSLLLSIREKLYEHTPDQYYYFCHRLLALASEYDTVSLFEQMCKLESGKPGFDTQKMVNYKPKNPSNTYVPPLYVAIKHTHLPMVTQLLIFGADVRVRKSTDIYERTAVTYARNIKTSASTRDDNKNIIEKLIEKECKEYPDANLIYDLEKYCLERLRKVCDYPIDKMEEENGTLSFEQLKDLHTHLSAKDTIDPNSSLRSHNNYYTFWAAIFTGYSAKVKVDAAIKLIEVLQGENRSFTEKELGALREGKLGDTLDKHSHKLLPNSFKHAEALERSRIIHTYSKPGRS